MADVENILKEHYGNYDLECQTIKRHISEKDLKFHTINKFSFGAEERKIVLMCRDIYLNICIKHMAKRIRIYGLLIKRAVLSMHCPKTLYLLKTIQRNTGEPLHVQSI